MATTMNNYLARVKLVHGADLEALEDAINDFITEDLEEGEYVTGVDVDITTVRDAPKPTSLYTATISVVGSTTTA